MSHSEIPDLVRANAQARPDGAAIVTEARTLSWADLDMRVSACADRLRSVGRTVEAPRWLSGESTVVGVAAWTGPGLAILLLSALRAGVVVAPLSMRWPAATLADAVARLGVGVLVAGPDAPSVPGVRRLSLADVTASNAVQSDAGDVGLDAPWTVVHTSGSSGAPKAAVHTVGNHVANARGVAAHLGLRAGDTYLLDLPLWHVGGIGIVARCALAGAAMAIPERGTSTADAFRRFAPTHASLVSTQLVRLLRDAPGEPFPHLRGILLGGSAMPPDVLRQALRAGLPLSAGYALTEMTSTVSATRLGAGIRALGTSGAVLPGRDVRVSAPGEIQVRGETLFAGYVRDGALDLPLTPDGWFATGDRGRFDTEARLVVTGRQGNRFVSGGENVQPEVVEQALARLDGVAEAVVVPISDAEFGFRPVAFVGGAEAPDAEALRSALRETLPGFAVPVAFHAWSGPDGMKPDRAALAHLAERLKRNEG